MKILVALLLALAGGCGTTCPTFKLTRCNGQIVEICGSNKKWQRVLDCTEVKAIKAGAPTAMVCGSTAKGCTCIPK